MDDELAQLSATVGAACKARGLTIATAESCTGGWAAQTITHTAGSSAWFERGFVAYANPAKVEMLDVAAQTLIDHGAVSRETASAMAEGALKHSQASISLAITGIAGPATDGAPNAKPVGAVWFAWGHRNGETTAEYRLFVGNREAIRRQAVMHALRGLLQIITRQ